MRHRNFGKQLGRNHHQRQALLKSLMKSLFKHSSIKTTKAKAAAVSPLIVKICRAAKTNDLISKRFIFKYFQDRHLVNNLIVAFNKAFVDTDSNFIKITPFKIRQGDSSLIVRLSLIKKLDYSEFEKKEEPKKIKKEITKNEK